MNIKYRLRKLETQTSAAQFCACPSPKCQIEYQEDGKPSTTMQNPPLIPDVCGECAKLVKKTIIIVNFTDVVEA